MPVPYPQPNEYAPTAAGYIQRVPADSDIFALLVQQTDELRELLQSVSDEQAHVRPAPGEWSIKEVVGHICDTERIAAYRALRIARGDTTPLPGFDPEAYVRNTDFNRRTLPDLIEEFSLQRRAAVLFLQPLSDDELARWGTARDVAVTARSYLFFMVGHVRHHLESLKTDYHVA